MSSTSDKTISSDNSYLLSPTLPSTNIISADKPHQLVILNATAQLPIKLTQLNFPSWRYQFNSILLGYNLSGYINDTLSCPAAFIPRQGTTTNPPEMVFKISYKIGLQPHPT